MRIPLVFHSERDRLSFTFAVHFRHEMERAIDSGGESRRRYDLAVVNVALVMNDFRFWRGLLQIIQRMLNGRCA